jgi:hypothetical protein
MTATATRLRAGCQPLFAVAGMFLLLAFAALWSPLPFLAAALLACAGLTALAAGSWAWLAKAQDWLGSGSPLAGLATSVLVLLLVVLSPVLIPVIWLVAVGVETAVHGPRWQWNRLRRRWAR